MKELLEYAQGHQKTKPQDPAHDLLLERICTAYRCKSPKVRLFKEVDLMREGFAMGDVDVLAVFKKGVHVIEGKVLRHKSRVPYEQMAEQLSMSYGFLEQEFGVQAEMYGAYCTTQDAHFTLLHYNGKDLTSRSFREGKFL